MKKTLLICLLSAVFALSLTAFAACSEDGGKTDTSAGYSNGAVAGLGTFTYDAEILSDKDDVSYGYNNNLFYVNNLEFAVADPSVIFITEGKDAGWFYAYGTSDNIGCHGFECWRSKDLSHWESMGVAMRPEQWAINNYWAPEVIYDGGMYYMFYGAYNLNANNSLWISVAVSETPNGPFVQPAGVRNYYGKVVGNTDSPMFDFTAANAEVVAAETAFRQTHPNSTFDFIKDNCLDASPFVDPVTGDKYLFFSYHNNYGEGSFIYGVMMLDWYTPDYKTLTPLTYPGYNNVENGIASAFGDGIRLREGSVNEGPFMVYHDGQYYLTLSIFGYTDSNYQVIQAVADSPLGAFEKISVEDGGKVVSTDVANWGHIVSAGHHSFIKMGDETFIAYHTFKNRNDISGGRALALDKVVWMTNSAGQKVMYTNGPTWSVQPLPEWISGYKNIATSATVTASNTAEGSDVALLNDQLIKYQDLDLVEEYEANAGESKITLSWDSFKTVRAVMVYNSYDYEKTFVQISSMELEFLAANGSTKKLSVGNIPFDWDWHFESDYEFMRPGGAAIAEFDEMPVKKITITINTPKGAEGLAIGEITVLGKDKACAGVSEFRQYGYEVTEYGSPIIVTESLNFGSVEGTGLVTEYGYDLTHDDGTENAYILQQSPGDQSCYFNDIYSTSFYVEAYFTTTAAKAFAYNSSKQDPYPKFGISISCDDDVKNTIFYYIDAAGFTNKAVGVAQRMMDNSNWDWDSTEQIVSFNDMNYLMGNYVKLAVIRQGAQFYFLCNDKVAIQYSTFNVFGDRQAAAVGFRCFSTPMRIKDYYASDDAQVVAEKLSEFTTKLYGENFGTAGTFMTTNGWDLSDDNGEHPVAVQSEGGDQYAYFKGFSGTDFYVEMQLTVTKDLGDPYPKFGLSFRIPGYNLFFFIDGSSNYLSTGVGYVYRNAADTDWVWGESKQVNVSGLQYSNGEYATLGILRQGSTFKFYVNGQLAMTVENIAGFGENDACVASILSFTTGITVKDYFITTNSEDYPT